MTRTEVLVPETLTVVVLTYDLGWLNLDNLAPGRKRACSDCGQCGYGQLDVFDNQLEANQKTVDVGT